MNRWASIHVVLFLIIFQIAPAALSQESSKEYCDESLRVAHNVDKEWRYTNRGNRCEGFYAQPHSLEDAIFLVSLTGTWDAGFEAENDTLLTLEWMSDDDAEKGLTRIRANSIQPGLFYRMDSADTTRSNRFVWNVKLLQDFHVAPHRMGLLAWVEEIIDYELRRVYLPVVVVPPEEKHGPLKYTGILYSLAQFDSIKVTLTSRDDDENPPQVFREMVVGYSSDDTADRPLAFNIVFDDKHKNYELIVRGLLSPDRTDSPSADRLTPVSEVFNIRYLPYSPSGDRSESSP